MNIDIVHFINKTFPNTEFHLYDLADDGNFKKASFCGPGTSLTKRLSNYNKKTGEYDTIITEPINKLDRGCMQHDIAYHDKNLEARHKADEELVKVAEEVIDGDNPFVQKANARMVKTIIDAKLIFGLGVNNL